MTKTNVVTDCGHMFKTGYTAEFMAGKTIDCKVCTALLIFPKETTIGSTVRGRDLNQYLHEQDPRWPADGRNAFFAEF